MEKFSRSFESFINHPIRFSKHFSRLEWYKTRLNRNSMSIEVLKDRRYNFLKNINNKFFAILARHACILPFCERNRRLLPNYKGTKTVVCGRHQTSFPFFPSSFSLSHSRRDTTLSSDRKETFIVSLYFKFFV